MMCCLSSLLGRRFWAGQSLRWYSVPGTARLAIGWLLGGCFLFLPLSVDAADFHRDIRPILSHHCFPCHGPDAQKRKADLRLDQGSEAVSVMEGGLDSALIARIISDDPDTRMPPEDLHKPLSPGQIELLKEWVADGAAYETHWAYQPLRQVSARSMGLDEPLSIDRLVARRLAEHGLGMSQQADKPTLIRRLYFDLLGLPPSADEVNAFVADDRADAYARLVDRLLASPQFGERMAVFWLDLVRYADTTGYHSDNPMEVSAYRRWVIDAFNDNKPFDTFTMEQIAGDLLPDAGREQKIASSYNRLLQTTEEGGAQPGEYRAIYAADRVRNVSAVWLGSTLGCAQCHDHKYDPFTARDFYAMAAFFADIKENAVGKRQPNFKIYTPEQTMRMEYLRQQIAASQTQSLLANDPDLRERLDAAQARWESSARTRLLARRKAWRNVTVKECVGTGGVKFVKERDGSLLAGGDQPAKSMYSVTLQVTGEVRAIRLQAMTDASFQRKGGFSRGPGNFVLTDFRVTANDQPLIVEKATADYSQKNHDVSRAIDSDQHTGWAVHGYDRQGPPTAVFALADPVDFGDEPGELVVTLDHQANDQHQIGRFRLTVSDSETTVGSGLPSEVEIALATAPKDRDASHRSRLQRYWYSIAPELTASRKKVSQAQAELDQIEQNATTLLVAESLAQPRPTRILERGDWMDEDGELVMPAVPAFLPHDPIVDRRATRLDLARWIVDDGNPLTSRTFTNRVWALFFGRGLSEDLLDLGGQGQPPTHPDLLDWMASDFQQSGWDVKRLVRKLVLSKAYQQSSIPEAEALADDPDNTWLSRQRRWRIDAEFVRDTALQLGGLLRLDSLGGRSVKPYQPVGYWQHLNFPKRTWQPDTGDLIYRRGMYTFWCRTFLHPSLLAFDAPSREECTAERARSNIPQQALVLLNDPIFVEASRAFAERIVRRPDGDRQRIGWAFEQAVSRTPSHEETELLRQLLASQRKRYAESEAAARQLLRVGRSAVSEEVPVVELAAWTQVARAITNLYETTARY